MVWSLKVFRFADYQNLLDMKYEASNGLSVEYKYRAAREDNEHLVVVFSGFRPEKSPYDFDGQSSSYLKSSVLWIRDSFRGMMCYYIRSDRGFDVDLAVHELIEFVRSDLSLSRKQCTFVGFSKGASAALYHAVKYDYGNLVISAPRINLGQGNLDRPYILEAMTESSSEAEILELDRIIPTALVNASKVTNIYLFSSEQDHLHSTETASVLTELRTFPNFNYVLTNSQLVRRHKDVTLYNIHLIVSLVQLLGDGITPKIGESRNGYKEYESALVDSDHEPDDRQVEELRLTVDDLKFADNSMRIRGSAIFSGYSARTSSDYKVSLILSKNGLRQIYPGKQSKNMRLSSKFYHEEFVDYSYAAFEINVHADILKNLGNGVYDLDLLVRHKHGLKQQVPVSQQTSPTYIISGNNLYQTRSGQTQQMLIKNNLINSSDLIPARESYWDTFLINESGLLDIRGRLSIPGLFVLSYSDADYRFLLEDVSTSVLHSYNLYSTNKIRKNLHLSDHQSYEYSGFASLKFKGLNLSSLPEGRYRGSVVGIFAGQSRSIMIANNLLEIQSGNIFIVDNEL